MAKSPPLAYAPALQSIELALRRLAAIDDGQPTEAHTATLRELQGAREEIAILARRNAQIIADADRWRAEASASVGTDLSATDPHDHDGLCWRALRDAIVSMCGVTSTEGGEIVGIPEHPIGEIATSVLRASPDDLGALSAAQIVASELHGLARDARAWRGLMEAIAGDLASNESDRESIASTMRGAIYKVERDHANAEYDRTHTRRPRKDLAPWAAWDAWDLGDALARAASGGIAEAQGVADVDATERDALSEEADEGERDDHAERWRTFVASACGSNRADGDARRLAWALRRAGLPVTSSDDTIETAEACAEAIRALLDRVGVSRVG